MKAGFAKVSILPEGPTSLAGYTNNMPRLYTHVHDEPHARALAVSDERSGAILISADILTPPDRLTSAVRLHALPRLPSGVDIVLHGHHTHSGPGNYWAHPVAKKFMGPFKQETFDFLSRRFADAAVAAWEARSESLLSFAQDDLEGLQENRRRADGPLDSKLSAFGFYAPDGRPIGAIVHFGGHPVIAAERDFYAASGDFPAAVCERMEKEFPICLFVNGAVGGLSIWFPETPIPIDDHFSKVADPIAQSASRLLAEAPRSPGVFAFSRREVSLPKSGAQPFPPGFAWWTPFLFPLVLFWNRVIKSGYADPRVTTVSSLRLGDGAFVFHPADFGVGAGLRTRENGRKYGLRAIPVSHADDYIGYVHPESEMLIKPKPEKEFKFMTVYENAMGFYGRKVYDLCEEAEKKALAQVSAAPESPSA